MRVANQAVAAAETSKLQADVDAARVLVAALPADIYPATVKNSFQARLLYVQTAIVQLVMDSIANPFLAGNGTEDYYPGTAVLPSVPDGYIIGVIETHNNSVYDIDGMIYQDSGITGVTVRFSVQHTASHTTVSSGDIQVIVDVFEEIQ